MTYLLALDQGTSSSRSIVFEPDGRIVAVAQRELTQHYPRPGWVEHDPMEIWQTQLETAREALARASLSARQLWAVGITNQRETTVLWRRRTGQPLHRAIVWQDRCTAPECARLKEAGLEPLFMQRTGLRLDPYFSGTKLAWLLDHVPGARELGLGDALLAAALEAARAAGCTVLEGTALPGDIAEFERESASRQAALDAGLDAAVEHVTASRHDRLMIMAMWGPLFQLAEKVREKGYSAKDFHPENGVFLGGGLKGAKLPANYKDYIFETFNLSPDYIYQMYGMQETQTSMPRCSHGRYHIPAWMVCLPLDKEGSNLLPVGEGEVTGRAAFFDLSLEGRWGGIISGDRIEVNFAHCACGSPSPSIADTIARYADLEGDDKIACSGTVDAYVRGVA